MKNIDKIRNMDSKEMALFFANIHEPNNDDELIIDGERLFSEDEIYNWLEKEVQI